MTQLIPRDDVPLEVIREGALEETAQDLGTGSGDRTGPAQPWDSWAPFLGDGLQLIWKAREARRS